MEATKKDMAASQSLESGNVFLFGTRVFVDVIMLKILRSSEIIWVDPKCNGKCPFKRHTEGKTNREKKAT